MKSFWKTPPRAKVYEAMSAIADGRVDLGDTKAEVTSSSGDKKYLIEWSEDGQSISSNDNASYYQGYLGYPIIAVLMRLGRINYNPATLPPLAGIHWKQLNTKFKRDYEKAVEAALAELPVENREQVEAEVTSIFDQISRLGLQRGAVRRPPPPGR